MRALLQEAATYISLDWGEFLDDIKPSHVAKAVVRYDKFLEELVNKNEIPSKLMKYINRELMVYDMYMADEILVFCYDPKDEEDGGESFASAAEYADEHYDETNFVNGVKVLDEYDFREQITANKFTGGYWEPKIHWVVRKKDLKNIVWEKS